MAIAEMRKLNLAAMSYDKDAILDALQRTGAAEVKDHSLLEELSPCPDDSGALRAYLSSAEAALNILCSAVEKTVKEKKEKTDLLKDGFAVSYSEFMSAASKKERADQTIARINALADEKIALGNKLTKCLREKASAGIYAAVKQPLDTFRDTRRVAIRLGTVAPAERENLYNAASAYPLVAIEEIVSSETELLIVTAAHKSVAAAWDSALSAAGFSACPFADSRSGEQVVADLLAWEGELNGKMAENAAALYAMREEIHPLKIYCDYVGYLLEKAELSDKIASTACTFLLEAYVPAESVAAVSEALDGASGAIYYEFSEPSADEMPPTLMKNNKAVSNFEAVTNMYSVPNAREFDPNTVMSFFYSLFLGFIMADIGYGLLMFIGGGLIWHHCDRESGLKRLSGVFAIGGAFAILWGVLFNSFFGFSILVFDVMPTAIDLTGEEMMTMWSFAGIGIPAVLIIAFLIGTVQLGTGYVCKAIQCWRRGQIADGICDGVTWVVFSIGVLLAIIGLVDEAGVSALAPVGGIIAAAGLLAAMLTAGRKEKFLGKFTKGFGAAYGVINYVSDILSYARLYGLMLSGMVIGGIVSQYAVSFITGGNIALAAVGVILMVVGHAFNLAISLLGAYIHDARLQYVEFYGKFYEGEGELFSPLGSHQKYIYVKAY